MLDLPLPHPLASSGTGPVLRIAAAEDLDAVVVLLADDPLSRSRGDEPGGADPGYRQGFAEIEADPSNALIVLEDDGVVIGTMQLTRLPGLSRGGARRLQIEAVRIRADRRSGGLGGAMIRWATDVAAPVVGARMVQLTSDASRAAAHAFYERLGFTPTHIGFKRAVPRA